MCIKEIGTIVKFNIDITIAIIILVILSLLSFTYALLPEQREIIRFVAIMIGGGSGIYSAYYSGVSLRTRIAQEKFQYADDFIKRLNSVDMMKLIAKLQKNYESIAHHDSYDEVNENEEMMLTLKTSLNSFESLSIAIQLGYVDEVMAHKNIRFIVCGVFNSFRPYINTVRSRNDDEFIYIEVERLAHAWSSNKYLFSGKEIVCSE